MNRFVLASLVAFGCVALGTAHADDPIQMDLSPAFDSYTSESGTFPVRVDITNTGPDAQGVLHVSSGNDLLDYPVELPSGSKKRFFTYGRTDYNGLNFSLQTNRGRINRDLPMLNAGEYGQRRSTVVLISDMPGALNGLRTLKPQPSGVSYRDAYVRPEYTPDRSAGFEGISVVILGQGSERLSDRSVEALKLWTMTGGTLTFLGGASFPTLQDPRWQSMLPATNFHAQTVARLEAIDTFAGEPVKGPFTVAVGTPIQAASTLAANSLPWSSERPFDAATSVRDGQFPLSSERPWGVGRVVVWSFDPTDAPLNRDASIPTVITKLLRPSESASSPSFLNLSVDDRMPIPPARYSGGSIVSSSVSVQRDPFSMKLPPTESILKVLVGYFFVVIPLNFLLLKKLKRGELAWFTAPVLSMAFAGVLFSTARNLYSAKLSSATQGVLVGQQGVADAVFLGATQMFVPTGGSYDLKLSHVDSLTVSSQARYGYTARSRTNTLDLQPVDVGEIIVPHMQADNLAFRQMTYRQNVPSQGWFAIRGARNGDYVIANKSPYAIESAALVVGYESAELGRLQAGETMTVPRNSLGGTGGLYSSQDVRSITQAQQSIALTGKIIGYRPGPQIGSEVPGRTSITLAFFTDKSFL